MFKKLLTSFLLSVIVSLTVFLPESFLVSPTQALTPPCTPTVPGDTNCDNKVDGQDYMLWRSNYNKNVANGAVSGDFNNDGKVDGTDYMTWRSNYNSSVQPTITSAVPTQPQTGELDITVCDPANGPFSLNITNEYYPLPVGKVLIIENATYKVQFSVLDQTEVVAGITTRVIEEREWKNGSIIEISRNFFVQASDGTVCYYGEDVDKYSNGQIIGHPCAWRAGVGPNKPGIIMPAHPAVGQKYQQEIAPGVAMDKAEHMAIESSYTTRAGTFNNVLYVEETPPSTKRYAPGIGMIYDDGMNLTSYR